MMKKNEYNSWSRFGTTYMFNIFDLFYFLDKTKTNHIILCSFENGQKSTKNKLLN